MAQIPFSPTPNVTTHADATTHFNANFADSESRMSASESSISGLNLSVNTQQTLSLVSGSLNLDTNLGNYGTATITGNANFNVQNSSAGDSGLVTIRQTVTGLAFSSPHPVLNGDINFLDFMTPVSGVGSVSWYDDGADILLYISDVT